MNLDRDCECSERCVARHCLECDSRSSQECCWGWCAPCTDLGDAMCVRCVWCEWLGRCAAPVLEEVCPDTSGALAQAHRAEPCTALGHGCVALLKCFKAAACCASETLTRAEALLRAIAFLGFVLLAAYLYWEASSSSSSSVAGLVAHHLREVALEKVHEELQNVTLSSLVRG